MSDAGFREMLGRFPGTRVLVVGDVMLDEYVWGEARRVSPEAPVPVVEIRNRTFVPGGAGNTAANVASLGGVPLLAGAVGNDPAAEHLRDALTALGIDAGGLVQSGDRPTTTKTRVVAGHQQIVRVDNERPDPLPADREDELLRWVGTRIHEVGACVLSDYAKGVATPSLVTRLIELAQLAGKPLIVDPKGTDYAKYRGATLVKPNVLETEQLLQCRIRNEDALHEAGRQVLKIIGGGSLLVTRGADGMSLFREGLTPIHIPSVAHDVFDVTGAGDTVISALAMALAVDATLEQAAHLANRAAGIVVGKLGTASVTLDELAGWRRRPSRRQRSGGEIRSLVL